MSSLYGKSTHLVVAFSEAETDEQRIQVATLIKTTEKSRAASRSTDATKRKRSRYYEGLETFLQTVQEKLKTRKHPQENERIPNREETKRKESKDAWFIEWRSITTMSNSDETQISLGGLPERREQSLLNEGGRENLLLDKKSENRDKLTEGTAMPSKRRSSERWLECFKKKRTAEEQMEKEEKCTSPESRCGEKIYLVKRKKAQGPHLHLESDGTRERTGSSERRIEETFSQQRVKQPSGALPSYVSNVFQTTLDSGRKSQSNVDAKQLVAQERRFLMLKNRSSQATKQIKLSFDRAAVKKHRKSAELIVEKKSIKTKTEEALEKVELERKRKQEMIENKLRVARQTQMRVRKAKGPTDIGPGNPVTQPDTRRLQPPGKAMDSESSFSQNQASNFLESDLRSNCNSTARNLVNSRGDRPDS